MIKNISYINSGNFLSKSLFLKEQINPSNPIHKGGILLITETNKELENYSKIFDFLNIDFRKIDNYEIFNDLIFNKYPPLTPPLKGFENNNVEIFKNIFYLSSLEILENIAHKKSQLEHFSITLNKNESYDFNNLIKKFIDL